MVKKKEVIAPVVPVLKKKATNDNNIVESFLNGSTEELTYTKQISVGRKSISATYQGKEMVRPNYSINVETAALIEELEKKTGFKKAQIADVLLNAGAKRLLDYNK